MKMPERWLGEGVQSTMWDRHRKSLAPVVMWGAVRALAGGEPTRILIDVVAAALKPVVKMDWLRLEDLIPGPVDPNWTGGLD